MDGVGTFSWDDGRKYVGHYVTGNKEGHGVYSWPDGRIYNG